MVKSEKIINRMKELNLRKEAIAAGLNISVSSFNNKLHGRTAFLVQEVRDLSAILRFSNDEMLDIFFDTSTRNVNQEEKKNG